MDAVMDAQQKSQVLVARAQKGDRAAFDELAERYRDRIASLIEARLGEGLRRRVDTEDLVQEVLLRAFSCLSQFRWSGNEALFRWLSTIARHVIYEVARREKRELILPSEGHLEARELSPSRIVGRDDRFERLKAAMDGLKPEYHEVILLARIRRLPMRDVAERMGRTPDAVAQLLRRALYALKCDFGSTESLGLPDRSLLDEEGPPDE